MEYKEAIDNWYNKELVKGDVRVDLEYLGEGLEGDFNPNNPDDYPHLRFSISKRTYRDCCDEHPDWVEVSDSSYCTQLPITITEAKQDEVMKFMMDEVYDEVMADHSIKKLCEKLSWIDVDMKTMDYPRNYS